MFDSPWHWAVVAIVAFVLFFGWKQLPEMSRSLGRSLRILKTEIKGMNEDDNVRNARDAVKTDTTAAAPATPRELPKADIVRPAEAPRPRPRPAPSRPSAGSRAE